MKIWKIGAVFLAGLLSLTVISCGGGNQPDATSQFATVARGDLTVVVSGSGNIKATREVNLSFSSAGKVARIFVQEGNRVSQGDKLASLETSSLELALNQAEVSLRQAEVSLTQARLAEETAAYNLRKTQQSKNALDLALFQAQINVATAQYNLKTAQEAYRWPDVEVTQSEVDDAEALLQYALDGQNNATTPEMEAIWQNLIIRAQAQLDAAEAKLKAQFAGFDTEEVAIKKQQLEAAQMVEGAAKQSLLDLDEDITLNKAQIASAAAAARQAERSVTLAQRALAQAQKQLDDTTLTAPFAGVIATVGAREAEIVTGLQTVIHLVDDSTLELLVELDEIDVPGVAPGQEVTVTADALPDTEFKGTVLYVYPVPREVGGIVLFDAKIQLQLPANNPLRVGMSATADITTNKKENVLLVPSRAVYENKDGQSLVKVWANGQAQERPVVAGIDDGIQIEIVSGLAEGEQVVIETRTGTQQSLGFF